MTSTPDPSKKDVKVRECDDCGDEVLPLRRRLRCRDCKKLVCNWCAGHVHDTRRKQ